MKTLNKKTLIGMGTVGLLLLSGSAIAGTQTPNGNGKAGGDDGWVAVCHQMTKPNGNTNGNPKLLWVPATAVKDTQSGHIGSGAGKIFPNGGAGHDDGPVDLDSVSEEFPCGINEG